MDCCLQEKTYNPFLRFPGRQVLCLRPEVPGDGAGATCHLCLTVGPEAQRGGWAPRVHMVPLARVTDEGAVTGGLARPLVQCFSYLRDSIPKKEMTVKFQTTV